MKKRLKDIVKLCKNLVKSKSGATAVEYAILVGLIAFVAIVGIQIFGTKMSTMFSNMGATIGSFNTSVPATP